MAEFVRVPVSDGARTLTVTGEVDLSSVETFLSEADACLREADTVLALDLGGVTFIDSSGLGTLVRIRNLAHDRDKRLVLANVPASVERLLALTGLGGVFDTRSDA
jgi:anti-anti-sigma factor